MNLAIIVILLGLLGLLIEPLVLLAFVVVLGYYMYKLDKRTAQLEARLTGTQPPDPKKPKQQ